MNNRIKVQNIWFLTIFNSIIFVSSSYHVDLIDNGPIVRGANITFTAILYNNDQLASGNYIYTWEDTAVPVHKKESQSQSPVNTWTVSYNDSIYPAGRYVVQVTVCKDLLVYCYTLASGRVEFFINETLNGDIQLIQRNKTRNNTYVSNASPVIHNITLKQTDAALIKEAPTVLTYWFVDCQYYSVRRDFQFSFNYTQPEQEHFVEALVVADFTPLPPPPTTTVPTTTTTTTTTKTTTTTVHPNTTTTTTIKPSSTTKAPTTSNLRSTIATSSLSTSTTVLPKAVVKRDIDEPSISLKDETAKLKQNDNGIYPYLGDFPFICNSSKVATDPRKTYGYFFKKIKVRVPVSKVNVTGNNWLQHGELLTLNVKCHASKNLKYCVSYEKGVYNVTGNENCTYYHEIDKCEFTIQRYLTESMQHTVVIIIENEVSKVVTPVAITVYKVKKQAQLSVIVVPVAFSLVAVVLIVFGVAYYIQNRSRFVVEVADFNFGQNYTDMEYKTFKERLRDSIANAFFSRAPSPGSSEVPVWPPGRKYGSMTS